MNIQTPATPAPAATPGSSSQNSNPAPVTPPASTSGASGNDQGGKVTITTKEFAQLSRDAARGRSAQRRGEIRHVPPADGSTPDVNLEIQEANKRADDSEKRALQIEVKDKVRDLLEKPEFEKIPKSTKAVILANPASLSKADNLEEALLDIEDFVRDQVLTLELGLTDNRGGATPPANNNPPGHATPPASGAGAPANAGAAGLEDLTKLTGAARSQAAIRNAIKTARGVKAVS